MVCVRHVLVATEAEAQDVLDELATGAAIEDLAVERSTDPSAADKRRRHRAGERRVHPLGATPRQQLDPTFVAAAMTSSPVSRSGLSRPPFGWHVIEARPFDEVVRLADRALRRAAPGRCCSPASWPSADVLVDPRYGRWDGTSAYRRRAVNVL